MLGMNEYKQNSKFCIMLWKKEYRAEHLEKFRAKRQKTITKILNA